MFDDLGSQRTRQLLKTLLEEMDPEQYPSFLAIHSGGSWGLILVGIPGVPQKNPDVVFDKADLQELEDAGYLRLEAKRSGIGGRLTKKARDEYRRQQEGVPSDSLSASPSVPSEMPPPNIADLHPEIVRHCRTPFETRQYDNAILNALKVVEEEIRARSQAESSDIGVNLVSKAMAPANPRIVLSPVKAEQEAAHALYRGAIGFLKNPQSHRFVGVEDPTITLEILSFASYLMRLLDKGTVNLPETS